MKSNTETTALTAAIATIFFWSLSYPGSRAALHHLAPEHIALLRFLVAGLFFLPFVFMGRIGKVKWRDLLALGSLGFVGIALYQLLFIYGMQHVTSGTGSLVIGSVPVFSALIARILFSERLSPWGWLGIFLSFAGVSVIAFEGSAGTVMNNGVLLLVAAALVTSFFFVLQKGLAKRYGSFTVTAYTLWLGTLPLLFFNTGFIDALEDTPTSILMIIIFMGLVSSGLAYTLWFFALSRAPAGIVTSTMFLQPIFAGVLGWLWLGEIMSFMAIVGGAISVSGVALVLFKGKERMARKVLA